MAQQTYGEFMRSNPENPNTQTPVDWFCPKCDSYVSAESVTFEETHQICNTGVIIKETNHMTQTAVEILVENLKIVLYQNQSRDILLQDFIKQAKEMEKQQIKECWDAAHQAGRFIGKGIAEENWQTFEEYYNETYGK